MQTVEMQSRTFTEIARRAQIVDAAIETLAEHGYANASFSRIAERAGLSSTAMISYYFESKADLDAEVVTEVARKAAEFLGPRLDPAGGQRERFRAHVESGLEFVALHPTHAAALAGVLGGGYPARDAAERLVAEIEMSEDRPSALS